MDSSSDPTIFEISSDEDPGWDASPKDVADWITEFLEKDDDDDVDDDDDEVVVLNEVKKHSSINNNKVVDDDDDECLILDGDPDKPVQVDGAAAATNSNGGGGDGSEEELSIVAEKGQLACRDYPHSRHLCAKFPFSTTSHATFCDMCHCYVCDIRAPCIYWGNGVSSGDHCHSTDKEDIWKKQRKHFKQMKTVQLPAQPPLQKFPGAALPTGLPLHKSGSALPFSPSLKHSNDPVLRRLQSNPLRACSSANSYTYPRPNIISNRHNHRSELTVGRNRLPHDVSRSHTASRSNNMTHNPVRTDRNSGGNLGPRFVSQHVNYKRVAPARSGNTRPWHGLSYDQSKYIPQLQTNYYTPAPSDLHGKGTDDFFAGIDTELNAYQSASQPNVGSGFMNSHSYNDSLQPPVYSQPLPQTRGSQNIYSLQNPNSPNIHPSAPNIHHPNASNIPDPNQLNYDLSWSSQTLAQSAGNSSQQFPTVQPTLEPSPTPPPGDIAPTPQGPPGGITDPAPSTEFDLDRWIQSLEPQEPEPVTAKDSVATALSFASHQEELVNEAMLLFDFENS